MRLSFRHKNVHALSSLQLYAHHQLSDIFLLLRVLIQCAPTLQHIAVLPRLTTLNQTAMNLIQSWVHEAAVETHWFSATITRPEEAKSACQWLRLIQRPYSRSSVNFQERASRPQSSDAQGRVASLRSRKPPASICATAFPSATAQRGGGCIGMTAQSHEGLHHICTKANAQVQQGLRNMPSILSQAWMELQARTRSNGPPMSLGAGSLTSQTCCIVSRALEFKAHFSACYTFSSMVRDISMKKSTRSVIQKAASKHQQCNWVHFKQARP